MSGETFDAEAFEDFPKVTKFNGGRREGPKLAACEDSLPLLPGTGGKVSSNLIMKTENICLCQFREFWVCFRDFKKEDRFSLFFCLKKYFFKKTFVLRHILDICNFAFFFLCVNIFFTTFKQIF